MKIHIVILALSALLFLGCNSKDSTTEKAVIDNSIELEINKVAVLNSGDLLIPTSEDARVELIKIVQNNTSEVILLQGSAKIVTP